MIHSDLSDHSEEEEQIVTRQPEAEDAPSLETKDAYTTEEGKEIPTD